jgi:hypothetical protein
MCTFTAKSSRNSLTFAPLFFIFSRLFWDVLGFAVSPTAEDGHQKDGLVRYA